MQDNKKKIFISVIIGVVLIVVLVVGASFSYVLSSSINNFTTQYADGSFGGIGSITLAGTTANLSLNLSTSDLKPTSSDMTYYASSSGKTIYPNEEAIGTTSLTGNGYYFCTYVASITHTGTVDMYNKFSNNYNNASAGQIVLTVDGIDYDFYNDLPETITGSFVVSENETHTITAGLRFVNSATINQYELSGTDLNLKVTINPSGFSCQEVSADSASNGLKIVRSKPHNLSTELIGNLYRYQGTQEEVDNNYICYGTTSKSTCTSNPDKYMYRIIGINREGQLKLIKKTHFINGDKDYLSIQVKPSTFDTITYLSSNNSFGFNTLKCMEYYLTYDELTEAQRKVQLGQCVGPNFLLDSNVTATDWKNKIAEEIWYLYTLEYYSSGTLIDDASSRNGLELYQKENKGRILTNRGWFMSLADYTLSYDNEISYYNSELSSYPKSWLHISNNDPDMNTYSELLSDLGAVSSSQKSIFVLRQDGMVETTTNANLYARSVFYTTTNINISGGNGTINNPYLLTL